MIFGGSASSIFTANKHTLMLFDVSVAVHVTVVIPTTNTDGEGKLHKTEKIPTLSVAVGKGYETDVFADPVFAF